MFGAEAPGLTTVKRWVKRFRDGETKLVDRPRQEAPKVRFNDKNIGKVRRVLEKERRLPGMEGAGQ
jgi:transposase